LPSGCERLRFGRGLCDYSDVGSITSRKGTGTMTDPLLYGLLACTYGAAAHEARRIGHARLACCYLVGAGLALALAACHALHL
jgi:hypothetical protein